MSVALKVSVLTAALLATFCLAPSPARAQTASAASGSGWTFDFTPYVWGVAMGGNVQGGSLPAIHIDMSFSDILHSLDAGLLAAFEARKGRWGMLFDSIYMKLEGSGTASRTGAGPIGSTANAGAELEVAQTMFAAAVAYRVGEGRAPIDAIGGLRYAKIEADATINGSLFAQSGTAARSAKKSWVDPYFGVRSLTPIADRWTFVSYLDIGGFGVGSDFTWQGLVGANYEFSKTFAAKFGYRYLAVDYDKDNFVYDMANSGLYLGLAIRF